MSFEDYTFRDLSTAALASMAAQSTKEVYLLLLTVDNDRLVAPLRYVDNSEPITSNSEVYQNFPFAIAPPNEDDSSVQKAQLQIFAHPDIIQEVRRLRGDVSVTLSVIIASEPDTVIAGPISLRLDDVEWDAVMITGNLSSAKLLDEPTPSDRFTPGNNPTLFE